LIVGKNFEDEYAEKYAGEIIAKEVKDSFYMLGSKNGCF
jgi:hypothetical protein